ncbi:MAG: hypothetical protein ABSD51_01435 [Candidatus Binatus sp.]
MQFGQVATIGAILLIVAGTAMADQLLNPKMPPSPEAYIADQNAGLDAVEASIAGLEGKKPLFAGVLHLAHGQIIAKMPLDVLIAYADALREAGVERVDIYTTQSAWPDKIPADIAKYDAVIAHIRQIGLKLGFDPTADPRTLKGGYAQWKPWAIAAYTEMARRYQPEKFSVMHEPTAMDMSLREKVSPATWAAFATQACAAIAAVSPHTVCTVAILPFERAEFDALIKVPAIKSIGFDIFGDGHDLINYDSSGLRHQIDELASMIKAARAAGKSLHIAETGRQIWDFMDLMTASGAEKSHRSYQDYNIGDPRYIDLDERWFETMAHYAAAHEFDSIMLFRTTTFFAYSPAGTNTSLVSAGYIRAVAEAVTAHKRTGMFDTYRRVVDSHIRAQFARAHSVRIENRDVGRGSRHRSSSVPDAEYSGRTSAQHPDCPLYRDCAFLTHPAAEQASRSPHSTLP